MKKMQTQRQKSWDWVVWFLVWRNRIPSPNSACLIFEVEHGGGLLHTAKLRKTVGGYMQIKETGFTVKSWIEETGLANLCRSGLRRVADIRL